MAIYQWGATPGTAAPSGDRVVVSVTSTPFTAGVDDGDLWLVDTSTIGEASVLNLPSGARDGQVFAVQDNQNDAFDNPITLTLPGGHQFEDGTATRVIFAGGGLVSVMKLSGTSWRILENTNRESWVTLYSGQESTSASGFSRVASKAFNPDRFPNSARFILEAGMETTNISNAHEVQLYNMTTASVVSTPLQSASVTPDLQADVLAKTTDLAAGDHLYEVQHRMVSGSEPDEVTLSGAHLRIVYSLTG